MILHQMEKNRKQSKKKQGETEMWAGGVYMI